jgi:hypothetical protein
MMQEQYYYAVKETSLIPGNPCTAITLLDQSCFTWFIHLLSTNLKATATHTKLVLFLFVSGKPWDRFHLELQLLQDSLKQARLDRRYV